jgi:hypothetical protein
MVGTSEEAGSINLVIIRHTYHVSNKEVTLLWPFLHDKGNQSDHVVALSLKLKLKFFPP